MDHMFKNANVGKTIKSAAGWVFAVECFLSIFGGIWLIVYGIFDDAETVGYGLLSLVVGPFVAWLSALILYGFGEIVDTAIVNRQEEKVKYVAPPAPKPQPRSPHKPVVPQAPVPPKDPRAFSVEDYWVCSLCDNKNLKSRKTCWGCDAPRPAQNTEEVEEDGWTCPRCEGDLIMDITGDVWFCPDCKKQFSLKDGFFPRMIEI